MRKSDNIIAYKFKAKLGNIYDGSCIRTEECEAPTMIEAIHKFSGKLYNTAGDSILSVQCVGYTVMTTKEIIVVEKTYDQSI